MNILIVDDEQEIRDVFRLVLETRGHYVLEASNGEEALCLLKKMKIHLVVTDLIMPIMDGFSLVRKLAMHYPLTRVMVVSSDISPLEDIAWLRMVDNFLGYDKIAKPTVLHKFVNKVERLLAA